MGRCGVAYRRHVISSGGSKVLAIVVYTVLRVALFAAVIGLAILVSGAISIVVLDRQRDRVGAVAAGFFRGINERIEASARAEDDDLDAPAPAPAPAPASGEGEQSAHRDAVDKQ